MTVWELVRDHQIVWVEAIPPGEPDGKPCLSSRFALVDGRELDHSSLILLCRMRCSGEIVVDGSRVRLTAKGRTEMPGGWPS